MANPRKKPLAKIKNHNVEKIFDRGKNLDKLNLQKDNENNNN